MIDALTSRTNSSFLFTVVLDMPSNQEQLEMIPWRVLCQQMTTSKGSSGHQFHLEDIIGMTDWDFSSFALTLE